MRLERQATDCGLNATLRNVKNEGIIEGAFQMGVTYSQL